MVGVNCTARSLESLAFSSVCIWLRWWGHLLQIRRKQMMCANTSVRPMDQTGVIFQATLPKLSIRPSAYLGRTGLDQTVIFVYVSVASCAILMRSFLSCWHLVEMGENVICVTMFNAVYPSIRLSGPDRTGSDCLCSDGVHSCYDLNSFLK